MGTRLEGKVCVVTGGTSGIGKACVEAFIREGAKVLFVGRREEKGKAIEAELTAAGGTAVFVKGELTQEADCRKIISTCLETFGTIDVLMNNAGLGTIFPLDGMDLQKDYEEVFNLNIRAYFILCQEALKYMKEQGKGNIINVASIGAITGMPMQASYAASKGAVVQLTRTIAVEYSKKGIRANTISPGLTLTEMVPAGSDAEALLKSIVPGGNAGTAEGVANAAVYLASDETPFMSGANLVIDGAVTCGPCAPLY
ncbi:MAG: SDR family oxidoreductase [Lachnospiraceae bacterium]|nr:SDR family oxidoreductase [Lachnospiraceae bacterium]